MARHKQHFEGKIQSLGFERSGLRHSVGVCEAGLFHLEIGTPERTTVICGELSVRTAGEPAWKTYGPGMSFEVGPGTSLEMRVEAPTAYHCEFFS